MAVTVTSTRNRSSLAPSFKEASVPVRPSRLEVFASLISATDSVDQRTFQAAVDILSGIKPSSHEVEAQDFLKALASIRTADLVDDEDTEDETPFNDVEEYSDNKKSAASDDDDDDEWEKPWEQDDSDSDDDDDDDSKKESRYSSMSYKELMKVYAEIPEGEEDQELLDEMEEREHNGYM